MIKINRCPCPQILQNTPRAKTCYNRSSVTSALNSMQFKKCAYCEKSIKEGAQVDHYRPQEGFVTGIDANGKKVYDWNEANKWENLLYSCSRCNGAKKKEKPFRGNTRVIIDPTNPNTDPENYIDFTIIDQGSTDIQVTIIPKRNSPIGNSTIKKLKLDTRNDHLGSLKILALEFDCLFLTLIVNIKQGQNINDADNQDRINRIRNHMFSNRPYSGFARSFFKKRLAEFEQNEKRKIEQELGQSIDIDITIPKGVVI